MIKKFDFKTLLLETMVSFLLISRFTELSSNCVIKLNFHEDIEKDTGDFKLMEN
jgi:hypothetical protein